MTQINSKQLAEISDRTPTAEAFFTYAACRERRVRDGISKLPSIRQQMTQEGFDPVPQDLLLMFRELDRAGIGQLKGDTFKWNVSIKEVGEAATQNKPQEIKLPAPEPELFKSSKTLVIFFDKNKEASVTFTPNLTQEQIMLLATKMLQECR